ncbi:MAG: DOMON domain-containing protein [Promethearchaeota archaeon]
MNPPRRNFLIVLIILTGFFIIIAGTVTHNLAVNESIFSPIIDGVITTNEYSSKVSFNGGDYQLNWQIEGDTIFVGIIGATTGWVAIGFNPSTAMKDADMVFGWVLADGMTVEIIDAYSTGINGPHPADTDQGGTTDILSFDGSESSGITTIEFSRLLITGDQYDNDIPTSGIYDIIWAMGPSDDFDIKHSTKGSGTMNLSPIEESTQPEISSESTEGISEPTSAPGFVVVIVLLPIYCLISFRRKKNA